MTKNDNDEYPRSGRAVHQGSGIVALLPIMAVVFIAYLVIGLVMPVLPLHVHQGLGLSAFVVGLVEAAEVIRLLAFYVGWPNAFSALPVAKDVFDKRPR